MSKSWYSFHDASDGSRQCLIWSSPHAGRRDEGCICSQIKSMIHVGKRHAVCMDWSDSGTVVKELFQTRVKVHLVMFSPKPIPLHCSYDYVMRSGTLKSLQEQLPCDGTVVGYITFVRLVIPDLKIDNSHSKKVISLYHRRISYSCPEVFTVGIQCTTSAFGDEPCRMLKIIRRFGNHCSCHFRSEYVMVGRIW
jgi:hypothetical protein